MRTRIGVSAVAALTAVAITAPSVAHAAGTAHCANLKLKVHDTGPVASHATVPVTRVSASGLTCAQTDKLFSGAVATVSGGGGNLGANWGSRYAPSGYTCRNVLGYWSAKHHADTLDWLSGWAETCTSGHRSFSFTEGKITPWTTRNDGAV